ncbi:hypothetical protein [Limobrevibacterium gyesilva]|uniref:Uncharacterized protein n=1 Tax=Limobrevibacterium gyesilva TaxID=2991712 RepID=A0AA42CF90_9PROT|nr:hypothetical protein [Limobrevibacterium gyesilva]MCW3476943.1 hypothetical protein [Limobrevibacterium gyesilva]
MTQVPAIAAPTVTRLPAGSRGAVLVRGSHGGLVGGDPAMALRVDGIVSAINAAAATLGARVGDRARDVLLAWTRLANRG